MLEVKGRRRRGGRLLPKVVRVRALLPAWKRWLSRDYSSNWATTDAICGSLIGPLLLDASRARRRRCVGGSQHRNMWVRRASAVSLIPSRPAWPGTRMLAYDVAARLHGDREDLIQKAVGWMLREAGKADPARLERYLRAPRSDDTADDGALRDRTVRPAKRRQLLAATNCLPSSLRSARSLQPRAGIPIAFRVRRSSRA